MAVPVRGRARSAAGPSRPDSPARGRTCSVGPPSWILLVGLAVPLAIIPLLLLDGIWLHVVGWVVAIFGSVGALAAFTAVDLRRRSSRWYVDQPALLAGLRVAVLVTGLVVASCFAYRIADVVARWDRWS